jgi:long-chain acyl-CoA synthetase
LRRHLLPALYARAREGRAEHLQTPLSPEDQALLAHPKAAPLWQWLKARYPQTPLSLDTNPQLDLGIDSLAWVTLTLDLERTLGLALDEAALARVATLRDLLQAAVAAADLPVPRAGPTPEDERWLRPLSPGLRFARAVFDRLNRVALRALFQLRVEDADHVPPSGPCLICPNHTSYLDPFAVAASLPRRVVPATRWGGWTGLLFAGRGQRLFSRIAGVLPVTAGRPGASLTLAGAVLKRGGFLVWFPEGARSPDGTLQRLQPGIGVLVRETGAAIVPVWIEGAYAAWPPHRRYPRRGAITVRFGRLIQAADIMTASAEPQQIADRLREMLSALAYKRPIS